jgi:hypothetical protein
VTKVTPRPLYLLSKSPSIHCREDSWAPRSFWMGMGKRKSLENCVLLGCYAACSDNSVPTFRNNVTGPIFQGQEVLIGYPETSLRDYHYMLHDSAEERSSHLLRDGSLRPCTKPLVPIEPQAPTLQPVASKRIYASQAP